MGATRRTVLCSAACDRIYSNCSAAATSCEFACQALADQPWHKAKPAAAPPDPSARWRKAAGGPMHGHLPLLPPLALPGVLTAPRRLQQLCCRLWRPAQPGEFKAGIAPRPPAALIQQPPAFRCAAGRPGGAGDALVRCSSPSVLRVEGPRRCSLAPPETSAQSPLPPTTRGSPSRRRRARSLAHCAVDRHDRRTLDSGAALHAQGGPCGHRTAPHAGLACRQCRAGCRPGRQLRPLSSCRRRWRCR